MPYNNKIPKEPYFNNNPDGISTDSYQNHLSYVEYLNNMDNDYKRNHSNPKSTCDSLEDILCYQAWMSKCEAELFCKTTSRLSYELYKANNLCEVRQLIDAISCLYTASAVKETALAQVIKAFCGKTHHNKDCDC